MTSPSVPPAGSAPGAHPTVDLIVSRLPRTPLVTPEDIASAIAARTTNAIIRAIAVGHLAACRIGGRYLIARSEAERWVRSSAVVPDEAE